MDKVCACGASRCDEEKALIEKGGTRKYSKIYLGEKERIWKTRQIFFTRLKVNYQSMSYTSNVCATYRSRQKQGYVFS